MDTNTPRTAVIGIGKDGSETVKQLMCDGIANTCLTGLGTGEYESELDVPRAINLVLVLGTVGPEEEGGKKEDIRSKKGL